MRWLVSSPTFTFSSVDGSLPANINVLDEFMADNDNLIPIAYPATYEYDRDNTRAVLSAAIYFMDTYFADDYSVLTEGVEPATVDYDFDEKVAY